LFVTMHLSCAVAAILALGAVCSRKIASEEASLLQPMGRARESPPKPGTRLDEPTGINAPPHPIWSAEIQPSLVWKPQLGVRGRDTAVALMSRVYTVPNLKCGGEHEAWVVRPKQLTEQIDKYPVLVFMHGKGSGGAYLAEMYTDIITTLAIEGYIVVALRTLGYDEVSSSGDLVCLDAGNDMLSVLEWAQSHKYLGQLVDKTTGAGLLGHSMGAVLTALAATHERALQLNVKAALSIHPHHFDQFNKLTFAPAVPMYVVTSDLDSDFNRPEAYRLHEVSKRGGFLIDVNGAEHTDICDGREKYEKQLYKTVFDCSIKGNNTACSLLWSCDVDNLVNNSKCLLSFKENYKEK